MQGSFSCNNFNLINQICKKIELIVCIVYFRTFSLEIKKVNSKLKIKINTVAISKDLVYFLNFLPLDLDVLTIPELILQETLLNLPISLKKLIFIGYYEPNVTLLNNLRKYKIPFGLKIFYKFK